VLQFALRIRGRREIHSGPCTFLPREDVERQRLVPDVNKKAVVTGRTFYAIGAGSAALDIRAADTRSSSASDPTTRSHLAMALVERSQ